MIVSEQPNRNNGGAEVESNSTAHLQRVPLARRLLPANARPFFGMRAVLERMGRMEQWGRDGYPMGLREARCWSWTFRWAAGAVEQQAENGGASSQAGQDFVAGFAQAPMIHTEDFARRWEEERPWGGAAFPIRFDQKNLYATVMDERISDAYLNSPATTPIWQQWWSATTAHGRIRFFLSNADAWADITQSLCWAQQQQEDGRTGPDPEWDADQRWQLVGRSLGLADEDALLWGRVARWWGGAGERLGQVLAHISKEATLDDPDIRCAALRAVSDQGLSPQEAQQAELRIWGDNSPLRQGLRAIHPERKDARVVREKWHDALQDQYTPAGQRFIERLLEREASGHWTMRSPSLAAVLFDLEPVNVPSEDKIGGGTAARRDPSGPAPEDRNPEDKTWPHLGDLYGQLKTSLQGDHPVAILVVGPAGVGKSTLLADLAGRTGSVAFGPDALPETHGETRTERSVRALSWAALGAEQRWHDGRTDQPDSVKSAEAGAQRPFLFVWDDLEIPTASRAGDALGQHLRNPAAHLIASATHLNQIPQAIRDLFDTVVVLEPWPVRQRLELARSLFADANLALRVARAIHNPRGIKQAARWCAVSHAWTWTAVRTHMWGKDQARGETLSQNDMDLVVPDAEPGKATPWVGYAHLAAVADRLCGAFEHPEAYERLGSRAPRGALLIGPPGTGKTLFARALAHRLGIPMLAPSTARLVENPDHIRSLMSKARRLAPCVLLLDEAAEMVCIGGKCTEALLSEMDGADPLDGVLVVATLNGGMIHPAMTRPGRLSEVHQVGYPEKADREALWRAYLARVPTKGITNDGVAVLVHAARGFTGADIAESVRRAGANAAAAGRTELTVDQLTTACDEVYWAPANGQSGGNEEDRRRTAVHEAGHALLAWRHGLEVPRITSRPRGGALGQTAWMPPEDRVGRTRKQWHGIIQMALGGLAAEQVMFGAYDSGGSGDLDMVLNCTQKVIADLGLGHLGPIAAGAAMSWSERRRRDIEDETGAWARWARKDAETWLTAHRDLLDGLATALNEARDLSGAELRPWWEQVALDTSPVSEPPPIGVRWWQQHDSGSEMPHPSIHAEIGADEPTRTLHLEKNAPAARAPRAAQSPGDSRNIPGAPTPSE